MPSATVVDQSKSVLPLKPVQPTQSWTFDHAVSLLKSCQDRSILESLDEFLMMNKSVLLNPNPFIGDTNAKIEGAKEITLRGILYSNISPTMLKDSSTIAHSLNMSQLEVLRIICQTCQTFPERKVTVTEKVQSKLPDDRQNHLQQQTHYLYMSNIFKERRSLLKIVIELLNNKTNMATSTTIQNLGKEIFMSTSYVNSVLSTIEKKFDMLIDQLYMNESPEMSELSYVETVLYVLDLHKVLVEILLQNPTITKETMQAWFKLVEKKNFLMDVASNIKLQDSFNLLKGFSSIVSILFFDLDNSFDSENNTNFLSDGPTFKSINDLIVHQLNCNSIVLYCWSIILLRKLYYLQEFPDPSFSSIYPLQQIDSTINDLNLRCQHLNVFQDIYELNALLKFDNIYSAILTSVLIAAMPLISLNSENSHTIASVLKDAPNSVIEKFFNNEATINAIVLSRAKFPLLLTPYLELASINGNFAYSEFSELKSYISVFKKEEFKKLYKLDDENTELVSLTEPVDLYPPYELNRKLSLLLEIDTKAKILPGGNNDEVLVMFLYNYSGWAFLGRVLQNISRLFSNSDQEKVDIAVQILRLLSKVVEDSTQENTQIALDSMSAYTDDSDILEVILRLLEQGLHSRNVVVSETVIKLLTQLMPFLSHRILPYLSKSSLLSSNGKDGFASTFFGAIEIVNGDYTFTISLIKLTNSLVQNCLTYNHGYPAKSKGAILSKFTKHLIYVFESFSHNKFNNAYQKMEVGVLILDSFSSILAYFYGIDELSKPDDKVTKVLEHAAESILSSFTVSSKELPRSIIPILNMIESFSTNLNLYELSDLSGIWYVSWFKCAMAYCRLVITIRSSLQDKPSSLEKQLFKKLPELVLIYSQHHPFKKDILDLITSLTNAKWKSESKASLLSHLGRDHAQVLMYSLVADLDSAFVDYRLKISLYDFICSVLEGDQQGLAVLFVSGRDVFGDFTKQDKDEPQNNKNSILTILKRNVRDIQYLPNVVSVHLLDAIALAFNSWTTVRENTDDNEFINDLIKKVEMGITTQPTTTEEYIEVCYELRLVSKIAEIIALFLFTSNNEKIQNNIIDLVASEKFTQIFKDRFSIKGYRPALHMNLELTFEAAFPQTKLSDFTVALNHRNRFGIGSIYNISLMDKLFEKESQWSQIKEQVVASSVNQQYLISQISLAKPLGALLVSFSRRFRNKMKPEMLDLVLNLLQTNINEGCPNVMFLLIFEERIQISFYLIYSIFNNPEVKKDPRKIFEVLKASIELLSSTSINYYSSLAESSTESTVNYRPLLRIIFCCLNLVKDDSAILIEYFSIFREIFDIVICKSTRTILTEFQNEVYLSRNSKTYNPSTRMNSRIDDLLLIMSILKTFVNVNTYAKLDNEIASLIDDNGTIKALLNLYSSSHCIEVNHEYVFANLSLNFIQELMKVNSIAEKFVTSGLFVVLVESPISIPIKTGGVNVTSGAQYHRLWTDGILPLTIISLHKIGINVVPEISLALLLFGKQIDYCIQSWSKDSSSIRITTATIAETSQILMLYELLQSMNVSQYLQSQQPHHPQPEQGEVSDMRILPGIDTESKREMFVNKLSNLLKHPKFLTTRISPSSKEEQRIIEIGGPTYDEFVTTLIGDIRDLKDFFLK
jgi:nuclear pore complex protein Nup188